MWADQLRVDRLLRRRCHANRRKAQILRGKLPAFSTRPEGAVHPATPTKRLLPKAIIFCRHPESAPYEQLSSGQLPIHRPRGPTVTVIKAELFAVLDLRCEATDAVFVIVVLP